MIPTLPYPRVSGVLLDDGSFHDVANQSFSVDVIEARGGCIVRHTPACGADCTAGFTFATSDGVIVSGPLHRVLAVRENPQAN